MSPTTADGADVPAGDSATFGGRVHLVGDTVFTFADYHTATADLEHLERLDPRTGKLITVASLVLPIRQRDALVLHECRVDHVLDAEVMAVFALSGAGEQKSAPSDSAGARSEEHPFRAWRASRTRGRFEPLDPARVTCSFDEVVD